MKDIDRIPGKSENDDMVLRSHGMQKKTKKRIAYIDVAKGLLILSVVLHHNILSSYSMSYNQNEMTAFLQEFQYYLWIPFFMPAFFVLTGYSSNFDKPFKPFMSSLIMTIGCPLFFFDIIPYNIETFQKVSLSEWLAQVPLTLLRFFRYSFWFLRVFFVAKLLYWLINKYGKEMVRNVVCFLLFIFACIVVLLGYGEHGMHSLMALFYISVGKQCRQYKAFEDFKIGNIAVLLYIAITMVLFLLHRQSPYMTNEIVMSDAWDIFILPLLAISGSIGIISLAKRINKNKILEYIGKYSLVIYCVHMLPYLGRIYKMMLDDIGIQINLTNSDCATTLLYMSSLFIYTVCVCCIIAFIIDRPYLRIMMGKRP